MNYFRVVDLLNGAFRKSKPAKNAFRRNACFLRA
jgi:hypothetical protein